MLPRTRHAAALALTCVSSAGLWFAFRSSPVAALIAVSIVPVVVAIAATALSKGGDAISAARAIATASTLPRAERLREDLDYVAGRVSRAQLVLLVVTVAAAAYVGVEKSTPTRLGTGATLAVVAVLYAIEGIRIGARAGRLRTSLEDQLREQKRERELAAEAAASSALRAGRSASMTPS